MRTWYANQILRGIITGLATFRTNDDSGLWSKRPSGEFKHVTNCYYTHTDTSTGNQNKLKRPHCHSQHQDKGGGYTGSRQVRPRDPVEPVSIT